jgi:thiamine monophosphate kinase
MAFVAFVFVAGGDDYELCFTVPNAYINRIKAIEKDLDILTFKKIHQKWQMIMTELHLKKSLHLSVSPSISVQGK